MTLQQQAERAIEIMPEEKLKVLLQFAEFLNHSSDFVDVTSFDEQKPTKTDRSEMYGMLKGKMWIAEDFDDTPEEFREYI